MTIFQTIAEIEKEGRNAALCMVIEAKGSTPRHPGSKMIVFPDGKIDGTVGGGETERRVIQEALLSIVDGKTRIIHYNLSDPANGDTGVCGGNITIYIEPITRASDLYIIGAGHVGKAVAHLAKWLGFRVVVVDDRSDLCSKENIPDADQFFIGPASTFVQEYPITNDTSIVLTTRGTDIDLEFIPILLQTSTGYVGVIGSKRRWLFTKKALLSSGISEDKLNTIHSPIGLDIGAETPEEIAVSIMAEIIRYRSGGTGKELSR